VDTVDTDRSATLVKSVMLAQQNGSGDFIPIQADASGNFKVDVEDLGGNAIDLGDGASGTGTMRVSVAAVAHDSPDSGNPVKIGGHAGIQAAVASGDRVDAYFGTLGQLGTFLIGTNGLEVSFAQTTTDAVPAARTAVTTDARLSGYNGTSFDRLRSTITGGLEVGGSVAHDAADAGNPLKVGGKATDGTPTAVADADRTDSWFDLYGAQVVQPENIRASGALAGAAQTLAVDTAGLGFAAAYAV
jgi:hypothetical protein